MTKVHRTPPDKLDSRDGMGKGDRTSSTRLSRSVQKIYIENCAWRTRRGRLKGSVKSRVRMCSNLQGSGRNESSQVSRGTNSKVSQKATHTFSSTYEVSACNSTEKISIIGTSVSLN
jgi:hypothetical protein